MDKTDRLRDYGLAFLLYEQGLGVCGYELIRELFIFVKLILNSYLTMVLSIDNDGKRKRIPQYTMAAQSVSPEYSAINSGNISPCFREANPNTIIAEVIAK